MSGPSDQNVNRIAFCSAVFAGVAYVGYTVVKPFFKKKKSEKKDDQLAVFHPGSFSGHRRVYLRRLSGSDASTSTEALLGTLEGEGNQARLILRPMSVRERIRELNLRARHFAETVLAVQVQQNSQDLIPTRRGINFTRSLQTSPTRSFPSGGLLLSPIEITHLASSRCSSIENIPFCESGNTSQAGDGHVENGFRSLPRNFKKRLSRRSIRSSRGSMSSLSSQNREEEDEVEAEGERLLLERQEELKKRLQGFEDGTTKILTPYEAKSLVALLHSKDTRMLERALVTVSNSAAFTTNQDYLREAGCLVRLQHLVTHSDPKVQIACLIAISNLALNTSNQKQMKKIVPTILPLICQDKLVIEEMDDAKLHLILQALLTLTNMAALSDWHRQFEGHLARLLELTQVANSKIRLQSLRLLVNLSTNEEMVPQLLAARAPEYVWCMLDDELSDNEMLRVITFIANLVCTAHKQKLFDPTLDLPLDDKMKDPESMYSQLFGKENISDVIDQLDLLMRSHANEDVRVKSRMVHAVLVEKCAQDEDSSEEDSSEEVSTATEKSIDLK